MKNRLIGLTAMFFTVIFWGFSFISIKQTVDIFRPMSLGFFRFIIALAVLSLFSLTRFGKIEKVDKKDMPMLFLAGFMGITVYFFFENNGVMRTSASSASMIIASIPVFAMLMETLVFKTKITWKLISGIALSIVGVWLIVGNDKSSTQGSITGSFFMLGAVLSWCVYAITTKPLFKKYRGATITYWQMIFGMIMFIPFMFFEKVRFDLVTVPVVSHLLFLAIFASAAGYFLYIIGMNNLGISLSSMLLNAIPLVTLVVAAIFFDEKITIQRIIGGLIIIASVLIATHQSAKPKQQIDKIVS